MIVDQEAVSIKTKKGISSINSILIVNAPAVIGLGGTVAEGANDTETDIRSGTSTLEFTLTNDTWVPEIGDDNATTQALIDGITGDQSWAVVHDMLSFEDVERVDDQMVRISIPVSPDYYLDSDESVSIVVPGVCLSITTENTDVQGFIISNQLPAVTLTGTLADGTRNSEEDIRTGSVSTIIFNLSGDKWMPDMGTDAVLTQLLIDGLSNTVGTAWDAFVQPVLTTDDVILVDPQTLSLTLPAVPAYDITSVETISAIVNAACLVSTSSLNITASPLLTVSPQAEAVLSDPGLTEENLGSISLGLKLNGETFNTVTPSLLSFTLNGSTAISVASVGYISPTELNLTLARITDFDLDQNINISISGTVLTGGNPLTTNSIPITSLVEPMVTAVTIPAGAYGIGDEVQVNISVNNDQGVPYTYVSGSVAGKALQNITRQTNTLYWGYFTVAEGDQDYPSAANIPVSNLRFDKGPIAGELYNGTIVQSGDIIDGHPPVVTSVSVSNLVYSVGDVVTVDVIADGANYTSLGTSTVNGIPESGPYVNFTNLGANTYRFLYTVQAGDPEVNPGELQVSVILMDSAGNVAAPYNIVEENQLAILINPAVIGLGGTVADGANDTEADIRSGTSTLEFTLTNDTWVPEIGDDNATTQALIDGITGDQSWAVVHDMLSFEDVERVDDQMVRISIPVSPDYYLDSDESVSIVVPGVCLSITTENTDVQGFIISNQLPAVTLTGTLADGTRNSEEDIRTGSVSTIIFNLTGDKWMPDMGTDAVLTQLLIDGLSNTVGTAWDAFVQPVLTTDDVILVDPQTLSLTLPAVPAYDITSVETISAIVNAACLVSTSSLNITASPLLTVSPQAEAVLSDPGLTEENLGSISLGLKLNGETFNTVTPSLLSFTLNGSTAISVASVGYISPTELNLTLARITDFDLDQNINISISGTVLTGGNPLTTNSIPITSLVEPMVTAVTIPAGAYGIGDEVQVNISVNNDQGVPYTYVSGSVAGKALQNITRQTNTLYWGYFTVAEGDQDYPSAANIPVSNLRFDKGPIAGELYNGTIVQSGDIIDGHRPVITGMTVTNGVKKIGDLVEVIVNADGNNYTAAGSETTINGYLVSAPNVEFISSPTGGILKYTIQNGDADVSAGNLQVRVILEDEAGNQSLPATLLNSNTLSIDAHPPVVTSISVENRIYSVGDIVNVDIIADGANYTSLGTSTVNGIPESGPYVNFTNLGANAYRFRYTVKASDQEVNPGELKVSVTLRDAAGNIGNTYTVVEENKLAIYTLLPTATLLGSQQICEEDSARLLVNLTGRGPWRFFLNTGSGNKEFRDINSSPYELYVKPLMTTNFRIDSVMDVHGVKNSGTGTALVTVNPKTDVEITNLNSSYSREASGFKLQANVPGGVFSGPGVVTTTSYFYPGIADTVNSPHTIYYTFTNASGCTSMDSALVFILGAEGDIYIPQAVYCTYNSSFIVRASNSVGSTGAFSLLNNSGQNVGGLTDNGDNTATVNPALLAPGSYTVLYKYVQDGANLSLQEGFAVEAVQKPTILSLNRPEYCRNEPAFPLEGDIPAALFSGPGVTGNPVSGFVFNPSLPAIGNTTVSYTNTSLNGCISSVSKTVKMNFAPNVDFSINDVCISPSDSIYFTNKTVNKFEVETWHWNFGDINSGAANISSKESDYHFYTSAGSRKVQLVGTTFNGCIDTLEKIIDFGNKPTGDFNWETDCFVQGDSIKFTYDSREVPVNGYLWKFYSSDGSYTEKTKGPVVYHSFQDTTRVQIDLITTTSIGCSKTLSKKIDLKPTITVDETPYFEDFNNNGGKWSSGKEGGSVYNSWTYGRVNFNGLGENASKSWYTALPQSGVAEKSWLISPCFDISRLDRPMIKLDYLQSLEAKREGAVLQTSVDGGRTWENVGGYQDGINWFNSFQIISRPGGQEIGWTGKQPFNPDKKWVEARHGLSPELAYSSRLRFRIAFASANNSTEAHEGFALDNVWIGNKSRKVLLEHFTNVSDPDSKSANSNMNFLFTTHYKDLVKLEYHTNFPGNDPMNADNRSVPATRSLLYGLSQVPYAVLDGGGDGNLRFNFSPLEPNGSYVNLQSLKDPGFDIDLNATVGSSGLTVQVNLTALRDFDAQERILQIAVYEKFIEGLTVPSGETKFMHVVKTMLPNAAGTAFFDAWEKGETRSFEYSWNYSNIYDPGMVRIAAFVQNDITNEIYQSATTDSVNISTSVNNNMSDGSDFNVYPNPARDQLNIYMNSTETGEFKITLHDQMGRTVMEEAWDKWLNVKSLDVSFLPKGIYFLRIKDGSDRLKGVRKVIIIGK